MKLNGEDNAQILGRPIEPETVDRKRESIREKIILRLTWLVSIVVVAPIVGIFVVPDRADMLRELYPIFVTGLFSVYASIVSFYFGEKSK